MPPCELIILIYKIYHTNRILNVLPPNLRCVLYIIAKTESKFYFYNEILYPGACICVRLKKEIVMNLLLIYAQCCAVCDTIAMADTYWFGRTINRKSCIIVSLSPVHLYNFVRNGLTL